MTAGKPRLLGGVLRRLMPKSTLGKVLVLALPLLVVLAFVNPLVAALRLVVDLAGAVLRPVLADPTGRLVVVCVTLLAATWIALRLLRARIVAFRAGLLLRAHLDALAAYVAGERRGARERWEKVARGRGPAPAEFPAVRADAALWLARLAVDDDDPGTALGWLVRVASADLPPTLQRAHAQLRARALAAAPEVLPASCRRELEELSRRWPDDVVILRLLRDRLRADGALEEAARAQERVLLVAEPARRAEERDAAAQAWMVVADATLAAGDLGAAQAAADRARGNDAGAAAHSLVFGELRLRLGDVPGALRAWSRVPGSAGLARSTTALAAGDVPLSPRQILECCPTGAGMLLAARAYARAGEPRRAVRAARRAARVLGPTPTVTAAVAEVLAAAGDPAAGTFTEEAAAHAAASARPSAAAAADALA